MPQCKWCQKQFEPSKFNPKKKYCCKSCGKKAYMKEYNQSGAGIRKNLGRRICGGCHKETNDLARDETYGALCKICRNGLKDGRKPATSLYSNIGSCLHGRDWWIGRRFG